jgi:hypothetical protein
VPPAGTLGLRDGNCHPVPVAPGEAEQTATGATSVGLTGLRFVRRGGPGGGPLPGGWIDGDGMAARAVTACRRQIALSAARPALFPGQGNQIGKVDR